MIYLLLHISLSLVLFIGVFLYSNLTAFQELDLNKDWELIKTTFKSRLKQNYVLKRQSEFILVRLKFLDNPFLKNSILVKSTTSHDNISRLKLAGLIELKPFGFITLFVLTFVFYIGAFYMYYIIKKTRQRELKEMQIIANLSSNI